LEKYTYLREFADSWGLLFMLLFFLSIVVFSFRPGNKSRHKEAANIALRGGDDLAADIAQITTLNSNDEKERRE